MDMRRFVLVAVVLMLGSIGALWWLADQYSKHTKPRDDAIEDLEKGRLDAGRSPSVKVPVPLIDRPRSGSVEILRVALPADDPRGRAGGATVLSLWGNNVLFLRGDPAEPRPQRAVLRDAEADSLVIDALALPASPEGDRGRWTVMTHTAEGTVTRRVTPEAAQPLVARHDDRVRAWLPERLWLTVAPVTDVPADAPRIDWPWRRRDPAGYVGDGAEAPLTAHLARTVIDAWRPGLVLAHQDEEPVTVRLVRFRWMFP